MTKIGTIILLLFMVSHKVVMGQPQDSANWSFGGALMFTHVDQGFDPWVETALTAKREKTTTHTLIGKVGYYNRFSENAFDGSISSYLFIRPSLYLNSSIRLGYGQFIPVVDAQVSINKNIHQYEISMGIRQMKFDANITSVITSMGYYFGNHWISYRLTFSKGSITNLDAAFSQVTFRKYLSNAKNYLEVRSALGQEINIVSGGEQVQVLPQLSGAIAYYFLVRNQSVRVQLEYVNEQIRVDANRNRIGIGLVVR